MSAERSEPSLGALAFRLRGGLWTLFFAGALFCVRPGWEAFWIGVPPALLGQLLRCWAAGSILRYRGEQVQAQQLVTWGPFAWIRNPLYAGNGLIGLGWAFMSGNGILLGLYVLFFVLLYPGIIIPHEERFLEEKFPGAYGAYRRSTGMLFPKNVPSGEKRQGPYDVSILMKSERHSLYVTLGGTLFFALRKFFL